jgi:CPA1 family monovalent cation:H+ antiporter
LIIVRFALIAVGTGQFVGTSSGILYLDACRWWVLACYWVGSKAHKRLPTDAPSDIALTLIEPYFMYWIAEQFHSSGVLAVVAGGLLMSGQRLTFLNSTSRVRGLSVWESFVFILNGIVFFIIGLDLPEIVDGLRSNGTSLREAIGYGLLVTAVLILARIISSYAAMIATLIFRLAVAPGQVSQTAFSNALCWAGPACAVVS